jgi:prepilin-type processing-associated H-X9-DG protein
VFFDYVIIKGTNRRAGTVTCVHDGSSNVSYADNSINDLGNTDDLVLSVDINSGNIRLIATASSDNWNVKTMVRGL